MPSDIWLVKKAAYKEDPEDWYEFEGYSLETKARDTMEVGDELIKIDALHQEYLGTLVKELKK